MGRIIFIASGKGGAGKSTVSVGLASALGRIGRKVLLIDADSGMRCLDIMLGVTDKLIFDLSDVLSGTAEADDAVLENESFGGISLIAAPAALCELDGLRQLIDSASDKFDFVIVDLPAGDTERFKDYIPRYADGFVVANPDTVSLRDAGNTVNSFKKIGVMSVRLVINKVNISDIKHGIFKNIDSIIDSCGARLIAVIPESRDIYVSGSNGIPIKKKSSAYKAFDRFCGRVTGHNVPLKINKL